MTSLTQPLRNEHADILPRIEQMRRVADQIGELSDDVVKKSVADVHDFLSGHLIAHAEAEEAALYPMVGEVCGAAEVTATMSREHEEIGSMVDELGETRGRLEASGPDANVERELRRLLYGLHALVGVHFRKEEEIFLPLLDDRLTRERADQMFEALHAAAHEALEQASRAE
ncbi:MAG: hemerythrin domain-containing protein [Nitriliruptorales bacterium]|nr:hemerythrin domain-containing protein [Nitriliruptorales bacterium]